MDIRLNYEEKGTGSTLILLHGNGSSLRSLKKQIEYFSGRFRVIALDTRGHGRSPRGEQPFSIEQFAEDLYEFMKEKSIDKADLLGFSDGGNIAITFALKHQEMIGKMIICGANLFPEGLVERELRIRQKAYNLWQKLAPESRRTHLLRLIVQEPDISPQELNKIKVPVLVAAGTKDMIKTEHTKMIYDNIKSSRLLLIEGTHFIPMTKAKVFNKAVEEFLLMTETDSNF